MEHRLVAGYWGFRDLTPNNFIHIVSEMGLNYIEFPMYEQIKTASHLSEYESWDYRTSESRETLVKIANEADVEIISAVANIPIGPDIHLWGYDTNVEYGTAVAKRAIDIGHNLDINVLRVVEPVIDSHHEDRELLSSIGESLGEIADYATARDVKILIENLGLTSDQVNLVLDTADHPAVGTNFDPHNYFRAGEDPLDALRNLKQDRIYYCHLKDAITGDNRDSEKVVEDYLYPPPVAVGDGEIEWAPLLTELLDFYDGPLAIEYDLTEDVVRGTRRSIDFLENLANTHGFDI